MCDASVLDGLAVAGRMVFDFSKRLPELVHRLRCGSVPFFDGDVVFGGAAWPMVSSLAALHGDSMVHFLTLDPAESYFLESTGCYGAFSTAANAPSEAYAEGLFGPGAEIAPGVIAYTADKVALFGDSGRWGVWSERNVIGLVVTDDPSRIAEWEIRHGPFMSAEDAPEDLLELNFGGRVPRNFRSALMRNYGTIAERS